MVALLGELWAGAACVRFGAEGRCKRVAAVAYTTDSTARSFRIIQAPNPRSYTTDSTARSSRVIQAQTPQLVALTLSMPRIHALFRRVSLCRAVCSSGSVTLTASVPGLPCLSLLPRCPKKRELNLLVLEEVSVSCQLCPPLAPRLHIWPREQPLCLTGLSVCCDRFQGSLILTSDTSSSLSDQIAQLHFLAAPMVSQIEEPWHLFMVEIRAGSQCLAKYVCVCVYICIHIYI